MCFFSQKIYVGRQSQKAKSLFNVITGKSYEFCIVSVHVLLTCRLIPLSNILDGIKQTGNKHIITDAAHKEWQDHALMIGNYRTENHNRISVINAYTID